MLQTNLHPIVQRHSSFELLSRLGNAVFAKRPILGELYKQYGMLTLSEFVQKQFEGVQLNPDFIERKEEIISTIVNQTEKLLGKTVAISIESQLQKQYSFITADHHGPITHPNFTNTNLLNSLYAKNNGLENVLILSSSNISFDNSSFPRGHILHGNLQDETTLQQLVLFPRKFRPLPVFNANPYTHESLIEANKRIDEWQRTNVITEEKSILLRSLINEIYCSPVALAQAKYSDQITITNALLWKKLGRYTENWPNLIYLEQERIVTSLIRNYHLKQETIISHFLFDEKFHALIPKYFNGISGAFNTEINTGTYLFWALPKGQKYRIALWKKGNRLETQDGSYSLELTPTAIARALEENEIYPSTLLSFIILGFYYGVTLIGGRSQTTYYSQMKKGYIELLTEIGDTKNIQLVNNVPTNKFSFPSESVAFVKGNNTYLPTTTLDLLLYGTEKSISTINEMANHVTFEQTLLRGLPTIYRMALDEEEQEAELLSLTPNDIDLLTGFDKQVKLSGELV